MDYEVVIGLEVHAQLLTKSKMFCRCPAQYAQAPPNTLVCPICLGMPGVLPTINAAAIEYTVMTGLALNCHVAEFARFERKNYHYPDLMKGYQISQYQTPLCYGGWLDIELPDGQAKRVGIRRVHLEEDTAKLFHRIGPDGQTYSLIDVNRSGVPLMEIVAEPDIRSAEEARLYLTKLRSILRYLGVSTGNMEEGAFRCDANISVRLKGSPELGVKVEVKNMNSFRAVYRALEHEAQRQIQVLSQAGRLEQETRGWLDERGITVSQRSKEYAHDYRYFPEPDLPPLVLAPEWVEDLRRRLPELPEQRRERFVAQYGLPPYHAQLLTASKETADYFEACIRQYPDAKAVSNWVTGELFRLLNATDTEILDSPVTPDRLVELLKLIGRGTVSSSAAKTVLEEMFATGRDAAAIVAERGLTQISDAAALEALIQQVLAAHPQAIADFQAGKEQALGFLVGQVMRATQGQANPGLVNQLLRQKLLE